ncbi:hydroxymethylbilane synthase [Ornithinimicrobium sp. Y1694]|uniref:hydroxymethylbilane synthase n=1 Tax=Ornithinimicrobium sp. Y1694 TaxID=3418590 RepID=UPI003CEB149E
MTPVLRLGTRASALATTQSTWVADRLRAAGHHVELVHVRTEGDASRASLSEIGGTGVFAAALRRALRDGEVDLAVHSLKDLPTAPEPGLSIAAVPEREDPRDVLVARDGLTLDALPEGSTIGTGSPRRAAQLAVARPDLRVVDIRGNVDTRIGYVRSGELDAVILARAGLARLGRLDDATDTLGLELMLPAPGQGALAVECRSGEGSESDARLHTGLREILEHPPTRRAVDAERAVLAALEAGCTAPVAALAREISPNSLDSAPPAEAAAPAASPATHRDEADPHAGPDLSLDVFVALGDHPLRHTQAGPDPVALGREVAEHLLSRLDPVPAGSHTTGA